MSSEPARDSIAVPAALIAVTVAARLVSLHALHPLNWDEIEFFRATQWIGNGLVPYRDFWEHHTPLQWFLFAPVAALTTSPGASAIIAMRWVQLPLWIATFWLINVWMRGAGIGRFPRWAALAVPLTSTFFMLPAVEYRVDVAGILLTVAGLVLLQRMERSAWYAFAAGASFALGGFANLRIGPALVVLMLLAYITTLPERRWGGQPRASFVFVGAAAMTAFCLVYFVATHSLGDFYRHVWSENYLADRLAVNVRGMFLHRLASPFGLRLIRPAGTDLVTWSGIDVGGIILIIAGTAGLLRVVIRRFRAPDHLFFIAAATLVNALFIAAMKVVYNYHLEVVAVLAVPLIAISIERIDRRAVLTALVVAAAVNASVALFRGKDDDLRYQDLIMREADRQTPAGSPVFDGAGWALHRRPAYRYWFLRNIVTVLEAHGDFEPYTPAQMLSDPPAAIIADHDARLWLARHPDLHRVAVTHYLPLWRDLWLPGLSAQIEPASTTAWIAPEDGDYRVCASPELARHPWFRQPLNVGGWREPAAVLPAGSSDLSFIVDGNAVSGAVLRLRRGSRVLAVNRGATAIGVMLVRGEPHALFRQPPPGVTLEGSVSPEWHVPALR